MKINKNTFLIITSSNIEILKNLKVSTCRHWRCFLIVNFYWDLWISESMLCNSNCYRHLMLVVTDSGTPKARLNFVHRTLDSMGYLSSFVIIWHLNEIQHSMNSTLLFIDKVYQNPIIKASSEFQSNFIYIHVYLSYNVEILRTCIRVANRLGIFQKQKR